MAKALRAAGATMPDDALLAVAEVHLRLAASLVQVNTAVLDVTDNDAVARYARTYLAPLVHRKCDGLREIGQQRAPAWHASDHG